LKSFFIEITGVSTEADTWRRGKKWIQHNLSPVVKRWSGKVPCCNTSRRQFWAAFSGEAAISNFHFQQHVVCKLLIGVTKCKKLGKDLTVL
jgi:hypothetical protein